MAVADLQTDAGIERPDSRTRSVWLTQCVLGATVVIVSVLIIALQPELFARWNVGLGVLSIVVLTLTTLAIPWHRLPRPAVLAVPFADALAIGLIASGTSLRFSYFWVLPVMWVAMHFSARASGALLVTIVAIILLDATTAPTAEGWLRLLVVALSLAFIAITAHLAMQQPRALRALLTRQATRLNRTVDRRGEQERRTTAILNGIDTGVARLSASGSVTGVNDAYAELYGLNPLDLSLPATSVEYADLQGMPIPNSRRPIARAARGEIFSDARVWLFTWEGEWRALSATSKRLEPTDGEPSSILLLVTDVTAVTLAERERERLTAMATHELRHPLTVLISTADLALESDELTPRVRARVETILGAGERMLSMTRTLGQAPSASSSAPASLVPTDVSRVLRESVESFRATARSHDVSLDFAMPEPLPIVADDFRLRQVFDNLISNAIKYTRPHGRVRVVGKCDGVSVSVLVADTGIGVSPEDLPKITSPYFRSTHAKETASGTGLGLSITKDIVSAHRGSMTISSELGRGTSIEVRLPRATQVDHDEEAALHVDR